MSWSSEIKQAIPDPLKSVLKRVAGRSEVDVPRPLPRHLAERHRSLDDAALESLRASIETHYHVGWRSRETTTAEAHVRDLEAHLHVRIEQDRNLVVPWLDGIRSLDGSNVLEIGCGTGSSTVALAEQGARVVAIDLDAGALRVAEDRCRLHGVEVAVRSLNATLLESEFEHGAFDLILFFACLEHMTVPERLEALAQAWRLLAPGGLLGVVDTPNRLWLHDHHTAQLPFFHWLPDDLAFAYSRFSARKNFCEMYRDRTQASFEHFLRRGRGASFHEFDLAIQPVASLEVAGDLTTFREQARLAIPDAGDAQYTALLRRQCPAVPAAFFDRDLNLVLRKHADG